MDVTAIDHVTLAIPDGGVSEAVDFYGERLGLAVEGMDAFEAGEKPFFDVRLAPAHVLHLRPTDAFVPPDVDGYDHVALVVDADMDSIAAELSAAGVAVERELDAPRGATSDAPAVYVRDPFGYRLELKARAAD